MRHARVHDRTVARALAGLVLVGLIGALAFALSRRGDDHPAQPTQELATAAETAAVSAAAAKPAQETAPVAPTFALDTVTGQRFALAAKRGKVVVLEFLAPGCPECGRDVVALGRLTRPLAHEVSVVIVDLGGISDTRLLRDYYYGELKAAETILVAPDDQFIVAQQYRVRSLGETVVIDRQGRIRWTGRWSGQDELLLRQLNHALT